MHKPAFFVTGAPGAPSLLIFLLYKGFTFIVLLSLMAAGLAAFPSNPVPLKSSFDEDLKLYAALRQAQGNALTALEIIMKFEDRFDSLIQYHAEKLEADPLLVKAIISAESSFDPLVTSPCSARGLMQVTDGAAKDVKTASALLYDPDHNLTAGIKYYQIQFKKHFEILASAERTKFALASYNAGRGNINKAIVKAQLSGADAQRWDVVKTFLSQVTGKHSKETIDYVDKIMRRYAAFKAASASAKATADKGTKA